LRQLPRPEKQKGNLRLDTLSNDFADPARGGEVGGGSERAERARDATGG
jgi:hypothetical protein